MSRVIEERHRFTREQLAEMAKSTAKTYIIGGIYRGTFGQQTVEWQDDGGIVVTTEHTPV